MSEWHRREAPAKLNLALVVGSSRRDGKHEIATVLQRLELCDRIFVREAAAVDVHGFEADTIVSAALTAMAERAGVVLEARIEKTIPVAAGLGGGSSDAAAALALANDVAAEPLTAGELVSIAASLGSDVPFFLHPGPQLGVEDGSLLEGLVLPQSYLVVLALEHGTAKESTASVYARFDSRDGATGFAERRAALLTGLERIDDDPLALEALPANDLASSPLAAELAALGAFRADVSGAGPVVYGLFAEEATAIAAASRLAGRARTWVTRPRW